MAAWKTIRSIGLVVQSARGWFVLFSLVVTAAVFVWGLIEKRPWSEITALAVGVLALATIFAYYALRLLQTLSSYLTSRKEQARIADALHELRKSGVTELDTGTAAAIWAGTRDADDVTRHLRFRQIKSLIAGGKIKNTRQAGPGPGPNIHTWMPIKELERHFVSRGILAPKPRRKRSR
jgi:hypothetical protein